MYILHAVTFPPCKFPGYRHISFISHFQLSLDCIESTMSGSSDYVQNLESKLSERRETTSRQQTRSCANFFSKCFKGRSRKVGPGQIFSEKERRTANEENESDEEEASPRARSWFRDMFLISQNNKLAWKMFGTKSSILREKKRQKRHRQWVIHPYSCFRYGPF